MKKFSYVMLQSLFAVEIACFAYFYVFGAQGLQAIAQIKNEICQLENNKITLINEIEKLQEEQKNWIEFPFYKEKIAREQLQMARPEELIYYLDAA